MMKTVVILQPGYLPWLGFFEQLYKTDIFVIYDDVQYTLRDWRSRNRIKTPKGAQWLSVPVNVTSHSMLIKDARIADIKWQKKHLLSLRLNYAKAPYFSMIYPQLEEVIRQEWIYLCDLDLTLIMRISEILGIDRKIYFSSQLGINGQRSERLLKICQYFAADLYLSGAAAKGYLNVEIFRKNNIDVEFQSYKHPVYNQLWGDFLPFLSVVDLLFNYGSRSLDIITYKK